MKDIYELLNEVNIDEDEFEKAKVKSALKNPSSRRKGK